MELDLITRRGCHLCDDAEQLLLGAGHSVRSLDVDADPELLRLYDFRVPVVLFEGRVIAEGRIKPEALAALRP